MALRLRPHLYANLQVNSEAQTSDDFVELTFQVKNTGKVAATEIAQIYLSPTDSTQQIRPIQLQGFARIALEPGQTKTVTTRVYVEQLAFASGTSSQAPTPSRWAPHLPTSV